MNREAAVLDACVLANFSLCDLLLKLAERPQIFVPLWSDAILEEVRRTQINKLQPAWPPDLAGYWQREVRRAFPEASVQGYEKHLPQCGNHEKDRHVLAAAIEAGARKIITFNLRHFRKTALEPWRIEALHPQEFLLGLYSRWDLVVLEKLFEICDRRKSSLENLLRHFSKTVPKFSGAVWERASQE